MMKAKLAYEWRSVFHASLKSSLAPVALMLEGCWLSREVSFCPTHPNFWAPILPEFGLCFTSSEIFTGWMIVRPSFRGWGSWRVNDSPKATRPSSGAEVRDGRFPVWRTPSSASGSLFNPEQATSGLWGPVTGARAIVLHHSCLTGRYLFCFLYFSPYFKNFRLPEELQV